MQRIRGNWMLTLVGLFGVLLLTGSGVSCGGASSTDCDPGFHKNDEGVCVPDSICDASTCSGHGTCDDSSGEAVCTCDLGYTGPRCQYCANGYIDDGAGNCVPYEGRCNAGTCSGHGTCDDSSGVAVCTCHTGYTGDKCDTCAAGFHDEMDECMPDTECRPTSCNGHGTCYAGGGFVSCVCDPGYAGTHCDRCAPGYYDDGFGTCVAESECTSGTCSGHGTCDNSSGVAICTCYTGWGGARCDGCAPGYHPEADNCVIDTQCLPTTCNGHGTCDDSGGAPTCTCETSYSGLHCEDCIPGYHMDANGRCIRDQRCEPHSCSFHGSCDGSGGQPVCTCEPAYTGSDCSLCAAGYHDDGGTCVPDEQCQADSCSGHGTCDDSTGIIVCTCDPGWSGLACERCAAGYHDEGGDCVADSECLPNTCNGHGTCSMVGGSPACSCEAGYTGDHCDQCQPGWHDDGSGSDTCVPDEHCQADSCHFHGACDDQGGVISCTCEPGYTGDRCQDCAPGYHEDAGGLCMLNEHCEPHTCNNRGTCSEQGGSVVCTCEAGYAGDRCETCAAGYHYEDGRCVQDTTCLPTTCNGHGTCSMAGDQPTCSCDPGWAGLHCDECAPGFHPDPDGNCRETEHCGPGSCGPHGLCDDSSGIIVCACDNGWGGARCDECAPGFHDQGGNCVPDLECGANTCNDHGVCSDAGGVISCTCNEGYVGAHCESCAPGFKPDGDGDCIPDGEIYCRNNVDDDQDGDTDCEDEDCIGEPGCPDCLPEQTLRCGSIVFGTNIGKDNRMSIYSCSDWLELGPEVAYEFVADEDGDVRVAIFDLILDLDLFLLRGECDNTACDVAGDNVVDFYAEEGETYYVVVDGYLGSLSVFGLQVTCGSEMVETDCDNGLDDDNDLHPDCLDDDCAHEPHCQDCDTTGTISCGQTVSGTTVGAGRGVTNYTCSSWQEGGGEHAYEFTAEQSSVVDVTLSGNSTDLDVAILQEECNGAACVSLFTQNGSFTAQGGTKYFIVVDSGVDDEGPYTLEAQCAAAGDEVCDDEVDNDGDGKTDCFDEDCQQAGSDCQECTPVGQISCGQQISGNNQGQPNNIQDYPSCTELVMTGGEVAYEFHRATDGSVDVIISDLDQDLDLLITEGTCGPATCLHHGQREVYFGAGADKTYYIIVDGYSGAQSSFTLSVECP